MRSRTFLKSFKVYSKAKTVLSLSALLVTAGTVVLAQAPMAPMGPMAQPTTTNTASQNGQSTDQQITELRAEVARLQSAVQSSGTGKKASPKRGMKMGAAPKGMGMMGGMGEMGMPSNSGMSPAAPAKPMAKEGEMGGMLPDDKDDMVAQPAGDGKMSTAPAAAMGMCCSGKTGGMGGSSAASDGMGGMGGSSSAMPGQAGASHLYHIGSNGFFLNHTRHITLTPDQRMSLNRSKEKAMLDREAEQRKIDQGEQELYTLTGSDQPDNGKIQAKVAEIEKMRTSQRMDFIRSVEEASNVLSSDQRRVLLGTMTSPKK